MCSSDLFLKDDGSWADLPGLDAELTAIAALKPDNNHFILRNNNTWEAATTSSVRTTLGLGSAATANAADFQAQTNLTFPQDFANNTDKVLKLSDTTGTLVWTDLPSASSDPTFQTASITGKLSFGTNPDASFIEEFKFTDTSKTNMRMHATNKIYITTGSNDPENLEDNQSPPQSGDAARDGVYINRGRYKSLGDPENFKLPVTYQFQNQEKTYALNFIHTHDRNDDSSADSLLQLSLNGTDIDEQTQFIGFTGGDDKKLLGGISGHFNDNLGFAQSGIKLESAGADYAEYLEKIDSKEVIEKGEIVGVFEGKITKNTSKAQKIMAVSSMPLVVGNWKGDGNPRDYIAIAFVGQVPVHVKGPVAAGDFIIPSGLNDGTGVAVSPSDLKVEHIAQILGKAWESSSSEAVKLINVAITPLDNPAQLLVRFEQRQSRLEAENQSLRDEVTSLRQEFEALRALIRQ